MRPATPNQCQVHLGKFKMRTGMDEVIKATQTICGQSHSLIKSDKSIQFQYVSTAENPAAIAAKGMTPQLLKENRLWWKGPPWLTRDQNIKLPPTFEVDEDIAETIESEEICHVTINEPIPILQ